MDPSLQCRLLLLWISNQILSRVKWHDFQKKALLISPHHSQLCSKSHSTSIVTDLNDSLLTKRFSSSTNEENKNMNKKGQDVRSPG